MVKNENTWLIHITFSKLIHIFTCNCSDLPSVPPNCPVFSQRPLYDCKRPQEGRWRSLWEPIIPNMKSLLGLYKKAFKSFYFWIVILHKSLCFQKKKITSWFDFQSHQDPILPCTCQLMFWLRRLIMKLTLHK